MHVDFSILIVDDEAEMLACLSDLLSRQGYGVDQAQNGKEALRYCRQNEYDLIISDIMMPEMDGVELLRALQEQMIDTAVVMMTGYSSVEGAVEAIKLGADDYITKPFAPAEIRKMAARYAQRKQLTEENRALKERLSQTRVPILVGKSKAMSKVLKQVQAVAGQPVHVLITGESGTGKDLAAQLVHHHSQRRDKPFIPINCAAIPRDLLESELFGHEKGAFTGAFERKYGLFEVADQGTLFLDEIGDMDLNLQSKLLRAVESGMIRRIGGTQNIPVDIRIVSSTNRHLEKRMAEGLFRSDLYYRLCGFEIHMPPLRDRSSDIPLLVPFLLTRRNRPDLALSDDVMNALKRHTWPGNVRELENLLDRLLIVSQGKEISVTHLPRELSGNGVFDDEREEASRLVPLQEMEKKHILHVMRVLNGDKPKVANTLGIGLKTLYRKLENYSSN